MNIGTDKLATKINSAGDIYKKINGKEQLILANGESYLIENGNISKIKV